MKKLLLHVCCAPCSIAVIDELKTKYDLSVLFYNPNIYPEDEYIRRKKEVVRVCNEWNVAMHDCDYDSEAWEKEIEGLEDQKEQGARCQLCISHRMDKASYIAKELGCDLFSTTLTMGRFKLASFIFPLAYTASYNHGVEYLAVDWKSGGRKAIADRLVRERNIYRQNYCGCKYSIRNTQKKAAKE